MARDTGGLAFPAPYANPEGRAGMNLRDYFAASALQGMCAHTDTWGLSVEGLAQKAYILADAMIEERGDYENLDQV